MMMKRCTGAAGRGSSRLLAVLAAACLVGAAPGTAQTGEVRTEKATEKASEKATGKENGPVAGRSAAPTDVREAVASAREAVRACKGTKGAARDEAMQRAVASWTTVATLGAEAGDARSEARGWYEAGVLQRRMGALEEALSALVRCLGVGAAEDGSGGGALHRERALFEQGQVLRRLGRLQEAVRAYAAAAEVGKDSARAHQARQWVGRSQAQAGDVEAALASLRAAFDRATRPRYVVEAGNLLIRQLVRGGDLQGASAVLEEVTNRTAEVRGGGGAEAARIQKAFDRMSGRKMLQKALDAERGAGDDVRRTSEEVTVGG